MEGEQTFAEIHSCFSPRNSYEVSKLDEKSKELKFSTSVFPRKDSTFLFDSY